MVKIPGRDTGGGYANKLMCGEFEQKVTIRRWFCPAEALVFCIRHNDIRVDKNTQGPVEEGKDDHQYWDYLLLWEYYFHF